MRKQWVYILPVLLVGAAVAQPRRHDRIVAVPAPKTVTVDGDLKEWDLSGSIECVCDESLRPKFTARVGLMVDAAALYIGAQFADDTPLRNRHDPAVEPTRGWAGDALQVRLCSDPKAAYPLPGSNSDRICHLTMWFYSDKKLPVLQLQYGMDYHGMKVLTGKASGVAFRATKTGYTLEARVPWALLNAKAPPKAGDRMALVLQPLWSDGSGWKQVCTFNDVIGHAGFSFQGTQMWGQAILSPHGNLAPAEKPRTVEEQMLPLTVSLPLADPQAKSVSAAVYSAGGQLVRTLPVATLAAMPKKDTQVLNWDGLDDDGRPLSPGRYTVKALTHRGIGQRWVSSLHNAGNPPWRTDDGTGSWGGDHGPPIAAAADAERVYLGWTISEAGWAVIALKKDLTKDNRPQKLWGQHQVLELGILVTAMASDGERLFVAQDGGPWGHKKEQAYKAGIVLWDAKAGKPINFPFGKRTLLLSEWTDAIKPPQLKTRKRISVYHPKVPQKRFWQRLRDHDFGPQELGLNLLGLAVRGDMLYASLYLENKVVAANWRTGKTVKAFPVPRPVGLAFARDGGLLAVSGKGVVRIDPASGKVAPVVKRGLSSPWGLTTDAGGHIYVSDCGEAMQVKVFDASGKPLGTIGKAGGRPWVGRYDPGGMLRPAGMTVDPSGRLWVTEYDSTPKRIGVWSRDGKLLADLLGASAYAVEGIADEQQPRWVNVHHTLSDVDYATGKTKTLATLVRPQMHGFSVTPDGGFMGRALRFRHVKGRIWAVHTGRGGVVVYRLGDDLVAEPVAALGSCRTLMLHGFSMQDTPAKVRDAVWKRPREWAFLWTDASGDGLVQEGELTFDRVSEFWELYWGAWIGDDLAVWSGGRGKVWRVPVASWTKDGLPVYPKPGEHRPLFDARGDRVHHVMPDGEAVYVLEQKGGDARGGGTKWQAVSRYTLDGKRLWAYRRTWLGFGLEAPLAKPGDVVGAMKFIGKAKLDSGQTLVAVNGYFGQFNVLSDDGLWVTSLCKDNRYGPKADATTVWPENFSGFFFRNRDDGKVYLIAGDTDARSWEITGLDTSRTAQASFAITDADRQKATDAAMRRQGARPDLAPIRLSRAKAVKVDGDLGEWDLKVGATFDGGAGRKATAALARDDTHLFVAFNVQDDSPMKNAGKDLALLFKTGDSCNVMLAADAKADPRRTRPVPGDLRLLFSVLDGKPVCVLYEPVVGKGGTKRPRVFSSPTGSETFGRVELLSGARVAIRRQATGYILEAAVPLKALRFAPAPGTITRGDVGVIFSDRGGSRNVLRVYYANKETAIVNDIPSEVRLQPSKWGVVQAE